MLSFIAILFILAITFFIGWRVGNSVPDEVEMGGEYLHLGVDILFVLLLSVTIYGFGYEAAALIAVLLIFARKLFPYLYGPVSGIVLGSALLLPVPLQIVIYVLALVMNFIIGIRTEKQKSLVMRNVWQPALAILVLLISSNL